MSRKVVPIKHAVECAACTTPIKCGSHAVNEHRGPRCVGKADGPDVCDCINQCGDDPWLADGRAKPCDRRAAEKKT